MLLADLPLQLSYRSGQNDLVKEFLIPCLESSELYRRAAGYFTSAGLALAARGVAHLASRGGKMKLIVSPHMEISEGCLRGSNANYKDTISNQHRRMLGPNPRHSVRALLF